MSNIERNLYISQFIRVISTFVILYALDIPLYCKILLIMVLDSLDCTTLHNILLGRTNWVNCRNMTYQISDKITDIICYSILLYYTINHGGLSKNENCILFILFIYRVIGTIIFITKKDRKYLFFFPNFFLEITLGLMVIKHHTNLKKYKKEIIILIILYKIAQEYIMHYNNMQLYYIIDKIYKSIKEYL